MSNKTHDHLRTYQTITQQADHSIEDQSDLSVLRRLIIYEERGRIAADLHDDLAQALTFIFTTSTAIRLKCNEKQFDDIADQLKRIEETAQVLLDDLRLTILGLKVANKLEHGLGPAIKNLSLRFSILAKIPIELEIDPDIKKVQLDTKTELQIFRVVQEALVNIYKHSNASKAWVTLRVQDDGVCLSILDNGQGFDTEKLENNSFTHFGVSSMHERAISIGASFNINSQISEGTQIRVTLT